MQLLKDLHQPVTYSVRLYCDNLSAIHLAENLVFHARTKHVEVHYHFLCEKVLHEEIKMMNIGNQDQVADIFTKGLSCAKFEGFGKQLSIVSRRVLNESSRLKGV